MKLHFTNEWLRAKIRQDGVVEAEAGIPLLDAAPLKRFLGDRSSNERTEAAKPLVLRVLIHQVRRRDGLSVVQFADKIRVETAEIELIESDVNYVPKPRTIHQLAQYLEVSAQAIQSLTADAIARNENLDEAAVKFAASSDDLSSLSKSERRSLNNFVKALSNYNKGK
ncbi:helix-turn-helix domain-containing protein [Ensifer aridi]|uniref:helix-turn-helix domain-containing protein n=1 Tax=Ensifer aridi TaxID=1708715 RepID=UPI0003FEF7C7|nr:helix-turn-helix domain-containing protein [Ensifer aridi]